MKHKFTRNIGLKFLSLIVAFLIWLLVANVDDPTQTVLFKNIKITTVNTESVTELDKVFDVVEDDVYGDTVIIKVTERSSVLRALKTSDFKVIADMEAINEVGAIPLRVECSNPSVTLDEMEVIPSVMKVTLEQKKQSDFVVTVTTTGSVANGYEVGTKEVVQGKTVQIAGPESLLNKIGKQLVRASLDDGKHAVPLLLLQILGIGVQLKPLRLDDLHNGVPCPLADVRLIVQHAGHRGRAHLRAFGNIIDVGHGMILLQGFHRSLGFCIQDSMFCIVSQPPHLRLPPHFRKRFSIFSIYKRIQGNFALNPFTALFKPFIRLRPAANRRAGGTSA